jgi:hypothetical protein
MTGAVGIVRGTVVLLVVYLVVLVANGPRNGDEVFPFFNWELFSRVPEPERTSWSVRLVEVNGEPLPDGVYFEDAGGIVPLAGSSAAFVTMQRFGQGVEAADPVRVDEARRVLESRYLGHFDAVSYELVRRTYDVLDRVTCDCFTDEVVIGEFSIP